MFIYLASSPVFRALCFGKLGCTEEPYGRRSTYLTGCPPGLTPSYDIDYDAIWETTANSRDELFDFEDEVHNHFLKYRMMREKPGDSEWFNFQGKNPCVEVKKFMDSRVWIKRQIPLCEILPSKKTSRYLRKQYHKNIQYIKLREIRNTALNKIQEPVISSISMFMKDKETKAGYIVAPCGSGKTVMCSKGIYGVKKCVICCPSKQIQNQWRNTLYNEGIFSESQIYIVGGAGTTDPFTIQKIFDKDVFCVISTYMSSHLLVDIISNNLDVLVLDEAHHMAGVVAKDEKGEGRTRRLMLKASNLEVKRLSFTYTPRFIIDDDTGYKNFITMDDDKIFGKKIYELKIRDLIHKGVLPDYRLWTLRDETKKGNGILAKAECILEAWEATEIIRGEEKHILHHLIVFASTIQEAKDLENFFKQKTTSLIMRVEEGDKLEDPISKFTAASRAILINCFVLNEGVDIPIANAVAITYPKQSRGQITQMVLRAGRWYEGKSVFHILIPTLGDEDLSGFEEVLCALASCDEQIYDEVILHTTLNIKPSGPPSTVDTNNNTTPECIMIEEFEANQEDIKRCFTNIRKNLFSVKESRRIQKFCMDKGIDTSIDYAIMRTKIPELPEDPRPKGITWYTYLHPTYVERISSCDFIKTYIEPNNLSVGHIYDDWRCLQSADVIQKLPSVQHITDGFFGNEDTNFNTLRERFGKKIIVRGR